MSSGEKTNDFWILKCTVLANLISLYVSLVLVLGNSQ